MHAPAPIRAIHEVKAIKEQFRNNSLPVRIPSPSGERYNCWGFVAFYFRWLPYADWLERSEMEEALDEYTKEVPQPRKGDIVVFRRDGQLTHTAVMLDKDQAIVCHKPGHDPLCVEALHTVENCYSYGQSSFRRLHPPKRNQLRLE
jgi:hypothetical protein